MTGRLGSQRYTIVAIVLHWLIAVGVIAMIAIGLTMTWMPVSRYTQFQLFQLHKSIGISILLLMVVRLAWRLFHRPPPLPPMTDWARGAAAGAHTLLYLMLFLMPLTGWAAVSASRYNIPTVLFGVIPWPHLPVLPTLPNKGAVEAVFEQVHGYGVVALVALLVLHIGAALHHHLVLRDTVMWRMLPILRRPGAVRAPFPQSE